MMATVHDVSGLDKCRQYLDNYEVVRILKVGSNAEKAGLNLCLNALFKTLFAKLAYQASFAVLPGSRDEQYAEEAFNDMLIDFHQQVVNGQFDPSGKASLPIYLYIIFYRKFWRIRGSRAGTGRLVLSDDKLAVVADTGVETSALDIPGRMEQRIVAAIAACSTTCRAALTLKYLKGLSPAQIAEQLGIAYQTTKNKLAHCSHELRNKIQND